MQRSKYFLALPVSVLACASLLVACGGGSSSNDESTATTDESTATTDGSAVTTEPLTGIFNDSPVNGLDYICAPSGESGTTSAGGKYSYEVDDTCTFSLGSITLGTAVGAGVVTPIDFVASGGATSDSVINVVRLLLSSDDNGDPSDGIDIPLSVREGAVSEVAAGVDITVATSTFETDVAQVLVDMGNLTLADSASALQHIQDTAACAYSGLYDGTFSIGTSQGTVTGKWGVIITPDGNAEAISSSDSLGTGYGSWSGTYNPDSNTVSLTGTHHIDNFPIVISGFDPFTGTVDANGTVTAKPSSTEKSSGTITATADITYTQPFPPADTVTDSESVTGTVSGNRLGGSADAQFRYTGMFNGDGEGVFAIDIDDTGTVASGLAYSLSDGSTHTLTGYVTAGTQLYMTTTSGAITIGGDLVGDNIENGTWSDSSNGGTGTFSAVGCQLN